jgi:hypothetical protein
MQAADASRAPGPELTLGVVATPGLPADVAPGLAADLQAELSRTYPELTWRLPVVSDALVIPPALLPDLIDAARRKLLSERWDMAVCLTDLPLPSGGRTVAGHVSVTHSVVVISVPAIGAVAVRRRLRGGCVAPDRPGAGRLGSRRVHRRQAAQAPGPR